MPPAIDVLMTSYLNSQDRIGYLARTVTALREHLQYGGTLRYVLSLEYAPEGEWLNEARGICAQHDMQLIMRPAGSVPSLGAHLDFAIPQINSDPFFYTQDDWLLRRDLNLDAGAEALRADERLGMVRYYLGATYRRSSRGLHAGDGPWRTLVKKKRWCVAYNPALWQRRFYEAVKPLYAADYPRASERRMGEKFRTTALEAVAPPCVLKDRQHYFRHIGEHSAFKRKRKSGGR